MGRDYTRWAFWWNYKGPGQYHITINISETTPRLSSIILKEDGRVVASPNNYGKIVEEKIQEFIRKYYFIQLYDYVIMPEHIHMVIKVNDYMDMKLGSYMAAFKSFCSHALWELMPELKGKPFFTPGITNKIIRSSNYLIRAVAYVKDNPRRRYIKAHNPDLFRRMENIEICGHRFQSVGNQFLLNDFDMAAVRVSSKFTNEELVRRKHQWLEVIENRGVLVSPFISESEKTVRDYALENGGRVILLRHYPFGERFKPEGRLFDLCAEGRLLILGMESGLKESDPITRELALYLNGVAEAIAAQ